ncbi:MAG: hypothetical protein HOV81_32935 [Kofleriaceae bacterium]|nr:hypothetical protein [Kofleriaceae bacterium]
MTCDHVRSKLTAYLDGELADDRGSAVRGHLRGCEACRQVASDEAALRDGLRALQPIDPPATLWAGVQARLAAAEVKDSERPAWRRVLARWAPKAPTIGLAGAALAAAAALIIIRTQHDETPVAPPVAQKTEPVAVAPPHVEPAPQTPAPCTRTPIDENADVTAAIAAEPASVTDDYACAARDLVELAQEARVHWADDRKAELDAKLAAFDKQLASAKDDRARQRTYRAMIRYLQHAVIRDDVALASIGGAP